MKTKRCCVIAVLLLAIVLGGCASKSSIRTLAHETFPEAVEIIGADDDNTLWLVGTEAEILLCKYDKYNSGGVIVMARMER